MYVLYGIKEDELEIHETNPVNMGGQVLLHIQSRYDLLTTYCIKQTIDYI